MRRASVLFTVLATAFALAVPAVAAPEPVQPAEPVPDQGPGEFINELPSLWFVELEAPPTSRGGNAAAIARQQDTFKANAASAGLDVEERLSFSRLWNGMSVEVGPGDAGKLLDLDGVVATYPVATVEIPETQDGISPDLATALAMSGADVAQSELGLTGDGIRVAVMDTGIDYHHPDLGGAFGNRVITGWDFVGDAFNADPTSPSYDPVPVPDDDPDDCNGHGTHVAGIVGADGSSGDDGALGVAPGVTFGAYKVFGCDGSTTADIMIAAMEMALADNMDILNMSIGSAFTWPGYPTAVAANNLVDEGMVVVASIGNSGAAGTFSAGAPGLGEDVIGVASFDNTHVQLKTFTYDDPTTEEEEAIQVGYATMSGAQDPPTSGTDEIVYVGRGCSYEDPENTPNVPLEGDEYLADPAGAVALIIRGDCSFRNKATRALEAGATAVAIYNNLPGNFSGTVGTPPLDAAVISLSNEDGQPLADAITTSGEPAEMTWTDVEDTFVNPTGGLISSFSSYGLAPDLSVKPDIGAPGGSIRSTYPLELGGYAVISGTSMASPHVAGGVALLLEARPDTDVEDVRDILQNSADPAPWSLNPGLGFLDQVHRQGAGMLDIDASILSTATVSPGKIALGETSNDPIQRSFTVHNTSSESVTYSLGLDAPQVSTIGTFPSELGFWVDGVEVNMPSEVTVPAGGSAEVDVTFIAAPDTHVLNGGMFGGYITLTPAEGEPFRVPYAGFGGDYQQLTVLTPSPEGLPAVGHPVEVGSQTFNLVDEGHVFTMEEENVPHALIHHHHQASSMTIEIYDANRDRPVHPVFSTAIDETLIPRNSTESGFFAWEWDGNRFHSNGQAKVKTKEVPDGDYYFVVTIVKALGDPDNPDHVETWVSPDFTIDRPDSGPGRGRGRP